MKCESGKKNNVSSWSDSWVNLDAYPGGSWFHGRHTGPWKLERLLHYGPGSDTDFLGVLPLLGSLNLYV